MENGKELPPTTRAELLREALSLIQRASDQEIMEALKAALRTEEKTA